MQNLSESLRKSLLKKCYDYQDELNQLLRQLIRIRSYSGDEGEIVRFITETMKEYRFDEVRSDAFGNAVGRIGAGPVKILYDAHIDTVRVTEGDKWAYPPFDGVIKDGKIYGRGAVDEKAAMAGFLIAGKILKQVFGNEPLPFTLYMVGSVLEEDADGYPLLHLIQNEGIKPDFVLLGEPTDLKIYRGQRGRMEIKISTHGKSAHGAHNQKGINAIYKMAPLIQAIEKLDFQLPVEEPLGKGSITISQIRSKAPSLCSVADYCQIHLDRRLTVGENLETAINELKAICKHQGFEAEITIPDVKGLSWKKTPFTQEAYFPTWMLEETHPLVQAAIEAGREILPAEPQTGFWSFSTNGVATAGRLGIPTIGFAPGKEELAHSDREEIILADLLTAAKFYSIFPLKICQDAD
jgi:putative selenium metabolism hydrolase